MRRLINERFYRPRAMRRGDARTNAGAVIKAGIMEKFTTHGRNNGQKTTRRVRCSAFRRLSNWPLSNSCAGNSCVANFCRGSLLFASKGFSLETEFKIMLMRLDFIQEKQFPSSFLHVIIIAMLSVNCKNIISYL